MKLRSCLPIRRCLGHLLWQLPDRHDVSPVRSNITARSETLHTSSPTYCNDFPLSTDLKIKTDRWLSKHNSMHSDALYPPQIPSAMMPWWWCRADNHVFFWSPGDLQQQPRNKPAISGDWSQKELQYPCPPPSITEWSNNSGLSKVPMEFRAGTPRSLACIPVLAVLFCLYDLNWRGFYSCTAHNNITRPPRPLVAS